MSKKSFYCWYLGFTEAYGQEHSHVYDLINKLIHSHNNPVNGVAPSKVTLHLNENSMTLIDSSQVTSNSGKKLRKPTVSQARDQKTYSIGYEKITFVGRLADKQYSDMLTCIVRNENSATRTITFYLHAFRCDSEETAKKMEQYLNYFRKLFFKKLEKQQQKQKQHFLNQNTKIQSPKQNVMFEKKEQTANSNLKENFIKRQIFKISDHFHSNSSGGTRSSASQNEMPIHSPIGSPPTMHVPYQYKNNAVYQETPSNRPQSPRIYEDIHREITGKLEAGEPFLFPPKDYSEANRKRGNLEERENRRCLNEKIVGGQALRFKTNSGPNKDENDQANELYLSLSASGKLDQEINTTRTDKSIDFNSLSFNEQATQVLNYLDEIVDSVDTIYQPHEQNRPMHKFQPPDEVIENGGSSARTPRNHSKDAYEPYEPLDENINNYQMMKSQNTSFLNRNPMENSFVKRTKNNEVLRMTKKPVQAPEYAQYSANVGIRNVLPVLGNYTPKMYGAPATGAPIANQNETNQYIYRRVGKSQDQSMSNKENLSGYKQQRVLAASDESIYKKSYTENNNRTYDPMVNHSLNSLNNELDHSGHEALRNNKGLRRTKNANTAAYEAQNDTSQFILKTANEVNGRNYVHVEDLKNYNGPRAAVIDVHPTRNRNHRETGNVTSRSYDIYY